MSRPLRTSLIALAIVSGGLLAAFIALRPASDQGAGLPGQGPEGRPTASPGAVADRGRAVDADAGVPGRSTSPGPWTPPDEDPDFESALRWSAVDLDTVRAALPENLYWEMSAPTDDPAVVAWREAERARWNREFGKVLSGTATEEEVDAYFALRRRISEDAVAFSEHLLEHYGDVLPERDVGLLELAERLHRARLEAMPRRLAEAHERRLEHERVRAAWLADEAAFDTDGGRETSPPKD